MFKNKALFVILITQFLFLSFSSLLHCLEFGYSIAPQDYNHNDPSFKLFKAAYEANIPLIKQLIKEGANVNEVISRDQPHGGYPILRAAIDSHSLAAVQVLLKAGANPNEFTESPIIIDEVNGKNNVRNLSLLLHAINSKAPILIIEELLKYGANIDGSPKIWSNWSALMVAAYRNYIEAIKIILEVGSKPNKLSLEDLELSLDIAKKNYNQEIITLLLKAKLKFMILDFNWQEIVKIIKSIKLSPEEKKQYKELIQNNRNSLELQLKKSENYQSPKTKFAVLLFLVDFFLFVSFIEDSKFSTSLFPFRFGLVKKLGLCALAFIPIVKLYNNGINDEDKVRQMAISDYNQKQKAISIINDVLSHKFEYDQTNNSLTIFITD